MKRLAWLMSAVLAFALPALAQAAEGVVVANVNLRAGPDIGYPSINVVPAGVRVDIQGCVQGYEWCDVIVGPDRGWIAAGYLQYLYQNQTVYVQDYGPRIGLPIVSFVIGTYWGNYYANRPFYRQRDYWYRRPFVHRPPPRPIHRPPPRPNPGWGGHRPSPGNGHRPPGNGYRPPGGGGHRPPPGNGNRPPPGNGQRPPPGGDNRPPGGGGNRPSPGGGNRPSPGGGNRPSPGGGGRPGGGHRPPSGGQQGGNRPPRPETKPAGQ